MKHISKLTVVGMVAAMMFAAPVNAQTDMPKPAPELKQLERLIGDWKYEIDQKAGPFGPAGKFGGTSNIRSVLNGFAIQANYEENNPAGKLEGMEIHVYDAAAKKLVFHSYDSFGTLVIGTETFTGDQANGSYTITIPDGKVIKARAVMKFASDSRSFEGKWDISIDDGKTWTPFIDIKFTKVE